MKPEDWFKRMREAANHPETAEDPEKEALEKEFGVKPTKKPFQPKHDWLADWEEKEEKRKENIKKESH